MDAAYMSALSALAGSAIGALSSFATTWLTQTSKFRSDRTDRERVRREALYGAFIDEVSKLFADALVHNIHDETKLVTIYSLISRMRLFAPNTIIRAAEAAMQQLLVTYRAPNRNLEDLEIVPFDTIDPLRSFSEACRDDLGSV